MNDLDVFRSARPAAMPLDDDTADAIHRAVFGVGRHTSTGPRLWQGVAMIAACAAAVAAVMVVVSSRQTGAPTIVPATTSGDAVTSTSSQLATPTSTAAVEDWRLHPERRFQTSVEDYQLYLGAIDSAAGRCMEALGFQYHGNPYQADSEIPSRRAPGSYEAAFLGEGDSGGGCQQLAVEAVRVLISGMEYANAKVFEMAGTWERTAFAEPSLRTRLIGLAECARAKGAVVRDAPDRLNKVHDDVQRGLEVILISDERLTAADNTTPRDMDAYRVLYLQLADELCPGYSAFEVDFAEANRLAQVAWVEANPIEMAKIQAKFDEDRVRFRYIIDHGGELPPA